MPLRVHLHIPLTLDDLLILSERDLSVLGEGDRQLLMNLLIWMG